MSRQWSETYDEDAGMFLYKYHLTIFHMSFTFPHCFEFNAERLPSECDSTREEDNLVVDTVPRLGGPLEHLLMQLNGLREREVNWMAAASGVVMGPFGEATSMRPVPPNQSLMASIMASNAASPPSQPPPLMHPFSMSDEASMAVASGAVGQLQLQHSQAHVNASSFLPALAFCAAGLGVGIGGLPLSLPLGLGVNVLRRAVFSDEQRRRLECHFLKHRYINKHERAKLAAELGLRDSQARSHLQYFSNISVLYILSCEYTCIIYKH